jgi:hypothetical protein
MYLFVGGAVVHRLVYISLIFIIELVHERRARILIVLCLITPLVQRCGVIILFSFYFVSFRESPLSRLASQILSLRN